MAETHGDISRAAGRPPLEHPYSALALALALSGSERWAAAPSTAAAEGGEGAEEEKEEAEGRFVRSGAANAEGHTGGRSSPGGAPPEEDAEHGDGELAGFGGDSSQLWSTDSERDEGGEERTGPEGEGEEEKGDEGGSTRGGPAVPLPPLEDADGERGGGGGGGDTQEWLRAFENDGERSPRTDGE